MKIIGTAASRLPGRSVRFVGKQIENPQTGTDLFKSIHGRTGILFFRNYWGPGRQGDHIDLWNGSRVTALSSWFGSSGESRWRGIGQTISRQKRCVSGTSHEDFVGYFWGLFIRRCCVPRHVPRFCRVVWPALHQERQRHRGSHHDLAGRVLPRLHARRMGGIQAAWLHAATQQYL
ncbi:T6SS effector amidase Tae4 family protein [Paracidovorax citrulli]|uniref:T6SS effector amidase Tae4 family protein n=1 Tax=Paracidovorax citrulli TaxID=80869 RepID=UPI0009451074|nr:T6SS effector amidase Tae4 family protein [Paracidovorax citrulli]